MEVKVRDSLVGFESDNFTFNQFYDRCKDLKCLQGHMESDKKVELKEIYKNTGFKPVKNEHTGISKKSEKSKSDKDL